MVITVAIDVEKGELVGEPVLQAKGFHGPEGTLDNAFDVLCDALGALSRDELRDVGRVKHTVQDVVRRLIQKKTSLRPLVLPTIVEI